MALGVVVADTDVCIDLLRGADPGASAIERWLRDGRLRLTAVTAFGLRLGADFIRRSAEIAALLHRGTIPLESTRPWRPVARRWNCKDEAGRSASATRWWPASA